MTGVVFEVLDVQARQAQCGSFFLLPTDPDVELSATYLHKNRLNL